MILDIWHTFRTLITIIRHYNARRLLTCKAGSWISNRGMWNEILDCNQATCASMRKSGEPDWNCRALNASPEYLLWHDSLRARSSKRWQEYVHSKAKSSKRSCFIYTHSLFLDASLDNRESLTCDPHVKAKVKIFDGMLECWEQPCILSEGVQAVLYMSHLSSEDAAFVLRQTLLQTYWIVGYECTSMLYQCCSGNSRR